MNSSVVELEGVTVFPHVCEMCGSEANVTPHLDNHKQTVHEVHILWEALGTQTKEIEYLLCCCQLYNYFGSSVDCTFNVSYSVGNYCTMGG